MVIFRDTRRFEITIAEHGDAWLATIQAFVPGRLYPTVYLMREASSREAAITAVIKTWHRLFPDEEPLQWHEPELHTAPSISRRPRYPEGRET